MNRIIANHVRLRAGLGIVALLAFVYWVLPFFVGGYIAVYR